MDNQQNTIQDAERFLNHSQIFDPKTAKWLSKREIATYIVKIIILLSLLFNVKVLADDWNAKHDFSNSLYNSLINIAKLLESISSESSDDTSLLYCAETLGSECLTTDLFLRSNPARISLGGGLTLRRGHGFIPVKAEEPRHTIHYLFRRRAAHKRAQIAHHFRRHILAVFCNPFQWNFLFLVCNAP